MDSELLRKIGQNLNPRPKPDVFGRRAATPLEIQQTINGETPERKIIYVSPRGDRSRRR